MGGRKGGRERERSEGKRFILTIDFFLWEFSKEKKNPKPKYFFLFVFFFLTRIGELVQSELKRGTHQSTFVSVRRRLIE